jgi:hypothetical protein
MAQIPSGTKFIGIDASVPTSLERNGKRINDMTEFYTVEDIISNVGENLTLEQARQNGNFVDGDIMLGDAVSILPDPSGGGYYLGDAELGALVIGNNGYLTIRTDLTVNPTSKGLIGNVDFSANYDDKTYVQKIYVDNPETLINVLNNADATQLETIKTILGII